MKRLMLILVLAAAIISPSFTYAQNQITRQKKKTTVQTSGSKPIKQNKTKASVYTRPIVISEPDGFINGHGYVDLGLPSGIKWATCNVGASDPSDTGDLYAWGETSSKSSYSEANSLYYGKSSTYLKEQGIINSARNLNKLHDAAYKNWDGNWRIPTLEELEELKSYCKWTLGTYSGQKGAKITGPNNKSIFLPAAHLDLLGESYGDYWSSEYQGGVDEISWGGYIRFDEYENVIRISNGGAVMYKGLSLRPVIH